MYLAKSYGIPCSSQTKGIDISIIPPGFRTLRDLYNDYVDIEDMLKYLKGKGGVKVLIWERKTFAVGIEINVAIDVAMSRHLNVNSEIATRVDKQRFVGFGAAPEI